MLAGQGSQVCIWHEVSRRMTIGENFSEDLPVPRSRHRNPDCWPG